MTLASFIASELTEVCFLCVTARFAIVGKDCAHYAGKPVAVTLIDENRYGIVHSVLEPFLDGL